MFGSVLTLVRVVFFLFASYVLSSGFFYSSSSCLLFVIVS